MEVLVQGGLDLEKLRPERTIEEGSGRSEHDCRVALARVAVGVQAVSAAERGKEAAVPAIGKPEVHFDGLFGSFCGGDGGTNSLDGGLGGVSLAGCGGTFKDGCDLAESLAEFLFGGQWMGFRGLGVDGVGVPGNNEDFVAEGMGTPGPLAVGKWGGKCWEFPRMLRYLCILDLGEFGAALSTRSLVVSVDPVSRAA